MADGDGAVSDFDIADRAFARAQTVEEIAHMVVGNLQPLRVAGERLIQQLLVTGRDHFAIHENPLAAFADKKDAIFAEIAFLASAAFDNSFRIRGIRKLRVGANDLGAVGVGVGHLEMCMAIVLVVCLGRRGALGFHGHRAVAVHSQTPLSDVVVVGAPVGHLAAGVLVPPTELIVTARVGVLSLF